MLGILMRTSLGEKFINFLFTKQGQAFDRFVLRNMGFSLMMYCFSAKVGFTPLPMLMIYTIGRKSGQERAAAMPYVAMDGRLYLVAANAGRPKDSLWVENLRVDPNARIIVNRGEKKVRARFLTLGSEEHTRLWALAITKTPDWEAYQKKTTRQIPLIALDPFE